MRTASPSEVAPRSCEAMMPSDFHRLSRLLAKLPLALTLASLVATPSAAVATPIQVTLVENVTGQSAQVEVMDYLDAGQTIRLAPQDTIILSYMHSCVREMITGGTVTVGTDQSEVKAGKVTRTKLDCVERTFVLNDSSEVHMAGRVFRGFKRESSETLAGGPAGSPLHK
jgi:hypothetical protein